MTADEIIAFKKSLSLRITALEQTLNMTPENNLIPELNLFRVKTGWDQFFYYLLNRGRIRAATELEALKALEARGVSLLADPSQKDQIEFSNSDLTEISLTPETLGLQKTFILALQTALQQNQNLPAAKTKAVNTFWLKFSNALIASNSQGERVLGYYISARPDLVPPIQLPTSRHQDTGTVPEYLAQLPSAGTIHDIKLAQRQASTGSPDMSSNNKSLHEPLISKPYPELKLKVLWTHYSLTLMDDIQQNIAALKSTLDLALSTYQTAKLTTGKICEKIIAPMVKQIDDWRFNKTPPANTEAVITPDPTPANPPQPAPPTFLGFALPSLFSTGGAAASTPPAPPPPPTENKPAGWKFW